MQANAEIKKYITEKGITQTSISRRTGIGLAKLNMALNGGRKLSLEEYELICGALGVGVDTFLQPREPDKTTVGRR